MHDSEKLRILTVHMYIVDIIIRDSIGFNSGSPLLNQMSPASVWRVTRILCSYYLNEVKGTDLIAIIMYNDPSHVY